MTNPDVDVRVPFTWAALPKAGTVYLLSTCYATASGLRLAPPAGSPPPVWRW